MFQLPTDKSDDVSVAFIAGCDQSSQRCIPDILITVFQSLNLTCHYVMHAWVTFLSNEAERRQCSHLYRHL
jgi:hypothetical protein